MPQTKTFLFSDFWPKPAVGELAVIDYGITADLHLSSIFSNSGDNKTFYQDDYTDNKWTATWVNNYHYQDSMGNMLGIMEVADWYPATDFLRKLSGPIRVTAFVKGYEIPWGAEQKVGDTISKPIKIDSFKSTFFTPPATGRQVVKFVNYFDTFTTVDGKNTYSSVVEVTYDQTFGKTTAGARSWFAKGKGIVQMQWRGNSVDVGDILVCKLNTVKGYINKDRYPVLG